jgi:hypothetical protein
MAHFQIWSHGVLFIEEEILKAEFKNWNRNANKKCDERLERVSGVPRNFVPRGGGSTNSVQDRENWDLGAVAP